MEAVLMASVLGPLPLLECVRAPCPGQAEALLWSGTPINAQEPSLVTAVASVGRPWLEAAAVGLASRCPFCFLLALSSHPVAIYVFDE